MLYVHMALRVVPAPVAAPSGPFLSLLLSLPPTVCTVTAVLLLLPAVDGLPEAKPNKRNIQCVPREGKGSRLSCEPYSHPHQGGEPSRRPARCRFPLATRLDSRLAHGYYWLLPLRCLIAVLPLLLLLLAA